ncbi:MAG: transporter substrate-binding domain-containing protein, partial [Desulfobacterales bacterium]|nr:transporter substrate-binding domain-containing protein [Desulfobacterales bacterium]
KTGIAIDFQAAVWDETLTKVGLGAVDAHAGLFFNKERDKFLDYGAALTETATHYFSHKSLPPIKRVSDLADYKVGVIAGDFVEGYLKDRLPHSSVVPFSDYDSLMKALRKGSMRVFAADTPTGLFHLKKAGLTSEFTFVIENPLYQSDWFVAVKEGNKPLIEVINQGMALINDEEKLEINRHWLGGADEKGEALVISIDRAYAPLTFVNSFGRPTGILIDLWRTWAKETGRLIKFRASSWSETLEGLKNGDADIHSGLSFSKEREEWIGFSTQIYETFTRIYHRVGDPQPAGIGEYGTDGVGVIVGSYQEAKFREVYPNVMTRGLVTTDDLINALLKGEVKAVVWEEAIMGATLDRLGLHGDITSRAERLFPSTIHAGVLKGNTDLLQEINNGLALILRTKLVAIEKPWIPNPKARFYQPESKSVKLSVDEEAW